MDKPNKLIINLEGVKIDPYTIQLAYDHAKAQGRTPKMLANTFELLRLVEAAANEPGKNIDEIKKYVDSNMLVQGRAASLPRPRSVINPNAVHPLSKGGSFGALVRECQITEQGLEEREGKGKSKLKEVTGFQNKVEQFDPKTKYKMQWIKQSNKYPFRVILQGGKKQEKAVYFQTKQQADKVRMYYVNKFYYKGQIKNVYPAMRLKYNQGLVEGFKNKLLSYNQFQLKNKGPTSRKSNMMEGDSSLKNIRDSGRKSQYTEQDFQDERIWDRASRPKSQIGYDNNTMNFLIDKDEARLSSQTYAKNKMNFGTILRLQKMYTAHLIERWLQLARANYRRSIEQSSNREKSIKQASQKRQKSIASGSRREQSIGGQSAGRSGNKSRSGNNRSGKDKSFSRLSPKKQESLAGHSASKSAMNKSSLRSSPNKKSFLSSERRPSILSFLSIEFLKEESILMKPIVDIAVKRNDVIESQSLFNTSLRSRQPHVMYGLELKAGSEVCQVNGDIRDYAIHIKAVDYLSNRVLCDEEISLRTKVMSENTLLTTDSKEVRLEIIFQSGGYRKDTDNSIKLEGNPEGSFLLLKPLRDDFVHAIHAHWAQEASRRGLFEGKRQMKMFQILEKFEHFPPSWAVGLTEYQFKATQLLQAASKILNFTILPSVLPITHILQKFYSQAEQLIEATLSLLTNYLRPYYFPSQFNKAQKLHEDLGLQGQLQFSSKISLEMSIIERIVQVQCPALAISMKRKNFAYVHVLYQCIYQFYATVFPTHTLIEIWNFCFIDNELVQTYAIIIGIWLIKFYQDKLLQCATFNEFKAVLFSHQTCPPENVIKELLLLREKYFNFKASGEKSRNRVMEGIVIEFYKRETKKIDERKENRVVEKSLILEKLNSQVPEIVLPKYAPKEYCLHLYFYELPRVPGSLYIKANGIEYQCRNYTKNRYIIIGAVNTQITIEFVDNKSDQFTGQLVCMQGVGRYELQLKSSKNSQTHVISYLCGLLTEPNIESIKKNRKFEHLISSFVKKDQLFEQFIRNVNSSVFLNNQAARLQQDDLGKKIKVIFSPGNRTFDEVDFYLRWIATSHLTLWEKIELVKAYARNLSLQFFLCEFNHIEKIFLRCFLEILEFPISQAQFECYYANSLPMESDSAKIVKCKFVLPNGAEHSVQIAAQQYLADRCSNFVIGDVLINDLLARVQTHLQKEIGSISEGVLQILVYTNGELRNFEIPVVRKRTNKNLAVDENPLQNLAEHEKLESVLPEILSSEVLPGMQKSKSILNFIEGNRSSETALLPKAAAQKLNILYTCHLKTNMVIRVRQNNRPEALEIPFLHFFHELTSKPKVPFVPRNLFLNNMRTDLKGILCSEWQLSFSDHKRMDPQTFKVKRQFYSKFRGMDPKTQSLYFHATETQQEDTQEQKQDETNATVFIYFGYGVYRWQPCTVKGYIQKQRQNKKPRRLYLINYNKKAMQVKQSQVQMEDDVRETLQRLDAKTKVGSVRKPEKTGIKFDLSSISRMSK